MDFTVWGFGVKSEWKLAVDEEAGIPHEGRLWWMLLAARPLPPHTPLHWHHTHLSNLLPPSLHPLLSSDQMCSLNSVKNNKTLAARAMCAGPTAQGSEAVTQLVYSQVFAFL